MSRYQITGVIYRHIGMNKREREWGRQTDTQTDTDRKMQTETVVDSHRQTDRQTKREREREREHNAFIIMRSLNSVRTRKEIQHRKSHSTAERLHSQIKQ